MKTMMEAPDGTKTDEDSGTGRTEGVCGSDGAEKAKGNYLVPCLFLQCLYGDLWS